jgi:hypothetical protein
MQSVDDYIKAGGKVERAPEKVKRKYTYRNRKRKIPSGEVRR